MGVGLAVGLAGAGAAQRKGGTRKLVPPYRGLYTASGAAPSGWKA